jgi:hypothetical protein
VKGNACKPSWKSLGKKLAVLLGKPSFRAETKSIATWQHTGKGLTISTGPNIPKDELKLGEMSAKGKPFYRYKGQQDTQGGAGDSEETATWRQCKWNSGTSGAMMVTGLYQWFCLEHVHSGRSNRIGLERVRKRIFVYCKAATWADEKSDDARRNQSGAVQYTHLFENYTEQFSTHAC